MRFFVMCIGTLVMLLNVFCIFIVLLGLYVFLNKESHNPAYITNFSSGISSGQIEKPAIPDMPKARTEPEKGFQMMELPVGKDRKVMMPSPITKPQDVERK